MNERKSTNELERTKDNAPSQRQSVFEQLTPVQDLVDSYSQAWLCAKQLESDKASERTNPQQLDATGVHWSWPDVNVCNGR